MRRVVIGENKNVIKGDRDRKERGVEVVVFDHEQARNPMTSFIGKDWKCDTSDLAL